MAIIKSISPEREYKSPLWIKLEAESEKRSKRVIEMYYAKIAKKQKLRSKQAI